MEIDDEERLAIYEFLETYSPPTVHLDALAAWEESEEQELFPRPPIDRQLEKAVALMTGESIERGVSRAH